MSLFALVLIMCLLNLYYASYTNFQVKRFEVYNKTQGLIKFSGNVTNENNNQYFTYTLFSPIDLDDNVGLVCQIFSNAIGKDFVEIFTIREKNYCKAANKYLGEFWYDIQRASQMSPGTCPIRAGKYSAHRVMLHFERMTLQTFPFGRLRFIIRAVDNKNVIDNVFCVFAEVENLIN